MLHNRPVKQLAGAIMGVALCVSSTAAGAAATAAPSISPLVALSAFGTQASSSAVCAAAGSTAISAAAQAPAAPGCVLPAVDAPVPVAQPAPPPPLVYAAVEQPGFGLLPVLLGLAAIAGLAALLLSDDDGDGDIDLPGTNPPLSP